MPRRPDESAFGGPAPPGPFVLARGRRKGRHLPRRKYGHLRVTLGKKHDGLGVRPGCPKCARRDCPQHLR